MIYETILPMLCKKSGLTFIAFTPDFKIAELDKSAYEISNKPETITIGSDIRKHFWEFIGLETKILNLKKNETIDIPRIFKNEKYYDLEIEQLVDEKYFIVYIYKKANFLSDYLKAIQELNKKTLILQIEEAKSHKQQNYHDIINQNIISFHVDTDGLITEVNSICSYFLGLDEDKIIGQHFSVFFHTRESTLDNSQTKIFNAKNAQGEDVFFHANVIPIQSEGEVVSNMIICQDITHIKHIGKGLEYAASHDSLTGLVNRSYLLKKIDDIIHINRGSKEGFVLCLIDIKNFKEINESFGHHAGDMLLKHLASILSNFVRDFDVVSRVGVDEFIVLFREIDDDSYLDATINRIKKLPIQNPLRYNEDENIEFNFTLTTASYPKDAIKSQTLVESLYKKMKKLKNK
jgi:diguanylate cyclase (GGDEF)-like protein/PAS domain S-box-containing protein